MNNEQQQIIDSAYENYVKWWEESDDSCNLSDKESEKLLKLVDGGLQWGVLSQEEFINKCKTDTEFSEKWGLKIEERELSLEERSKIWNETHNPAGNIYTHNQYDENNLPTKLITVTRELNRDERIELYNKEYGILGNKYEHPFDDFIDAKLTTRNIPINETIESYE